MAVAEMLLDLGGQYARRQRHVPHRFQQLVEHRVASVDGLLDALDPGRLLVQIRSRLGQCVELTGRLRELVVEIGKLLFFDGAHGDLAVDLFAGVGAEQGGVEGRGFAG